MKVGSDLEDDKRRSQIIRQEIGYQHKLVLISTIDINLSILVLISTIDINLSIFDLPAYYQVL